MMKNKNKMQIKIKYLINLEVTIKKKLTILIDQIWNNKKS